MLFRSLIVDSVAPAESQGYFIPGVGLPQWQVPVDVKPLSRENFLFHRSEDPEQRENLWGREPNKRSWMLEVTRDLLGEEGAPPEQYERLGIGAR
jgi:hypothetical protein